MTGVEGNRGPAKSALDAAQARWPDLRCDLEAFASHIGSLADRDSAQDSISRPDELALAFCCAAGHTAALKVLESEFLNQIPRYVARIDNNADFTDEITQQVREKLLVGSPKEPTPRILTYTGRGPLGGWIRVVSVRLALSAKTGKHSASHNDEDSGDLAELAIPVEEEVTKAANAQPFQDALRGALARLTPRERNLLRLRFVDNWSPEDIGRSYGVHRATVARWISAARATVREAMAEELVAKMGFRRSEFDSVARLIESRMHISLSRLS